MAKQSTIVTDGTTSIELVFDASTQPNWRLQFGERVEGGTPRPVWHQSESAPPELVDLVGQNGEARMTLNVRQNDDIDTVLNKIAELSRLVDGPNSQAARYWTHGDVDRVDLKVQRKNATNATLWPIIWGEVDDGAAHYNEMADLREWAVGVRIRLFLAPYGEAETAMTLHNFLFNPAFLDGNTSGLAWGWNDQGTVSFINSSSTRSLVGDRSQRVDSSGANAGLRSTAISIGDDTNIVAYAWVQVKSPDSVTVRLRNVTDLTTLDSKVLDATDSNNISDKQAPAVDGLSTFYRVVVSGQNTTGTSKNYELQILGNAVYWVDACYFDTGTQTPPDAFSSYFGIDNRYDPTASNLIRINYIDVWGVPGDAPALVNIELDWTTITGADKDLVVAGRGVDGRILAADQTGWLESDDFTTSLTFNASWSTGTGTSNDHFFRLTQDGTASAGSGNLTITISGAAARQLLTKPVRVFARCRGSSTAGTFQLSAVAGFYDSGEASLSSTGLWSMLDMGVLNGQGLAPLDQPDSSSPDVTLTFQVQDLPASGSDTADFDALLFVPVDEFMVVDSSTPLTTSKSAHIRGQHEDFIVDTHGFAATERLGTLWHLEPGNKMNRLRFGLSATSDKQWDLTDAANVTLTIIPRTRHLLGTT